MKRKLKELVLNAKCLVLGALCAVGLAAFAANGPLLVPDYNRDGKIDTADCDRLAAGEAFTVWLNDDDDAEGTDDGAEAGDTNNDLHDVPGGDGNDKDCEDGQVNGRCDLLDFFPVLVDVSGVDGWDTMTWKLVSASVNVVFTGLNKDTAGSFHTTEVKALEDETPLYKAEVEQLAEGDAELPNGFLKGGKGVILVEGAALGDAGLTLRGEGGEGAEVTLKLSVKNVEDMYGWLNLRPKAKDEDEGEQWKVENSTVRLPTTTTPTTDDRHFIFVHGYNTNHEEARGNAAEFYKKLWQSGSDAMMTAVEWRGDQSQIKFELLGVNFSPNYHVNVENAFLAARPFAEACKKLPGEKILVGHSLGNMLIASAIRDYGLDYTKYVMLNAAVPREAFDANAYDEDMVDDDWLDTNERPLLDRASRWYKNFAGKEYDPYEYRRKLAWRGRFANLPRTVNYYSPTDNILLNPDPNEKDPDEIFDRNDPEVYNEVRALLVAKLVNGRSIGPDGKKKTGFGFWSFSEKMKGTWLLDTVNDVLTNMLGVAQADAYKREAGWGDNDKYEEGMSFDPANTRFTPFLDERLKARGMLDILPAETERVRAQHLADAIPAESFAAGANPVATLENVNEESFIGENPEWPVYVGENEQTNEWNHSTFREVAFYHTSKLYASLAATGKPRVILDTNLGGSKDDLFARDLAARMHEAGKLDVLAVMTNGTDDVTRYTNLLETASAESVVICALGTGDNLTNLLKEAPGLVAEKVKELRVVDGAIVPQGWPTKVVVTSARPAFYESKAILADFPAGTLSPAIREAEMNDRTGARLAAPMAILPLTEGETITNQTAAAIMDRLRAIYRTGNPSVSVIPISIAEAGVDYNGSVLAVKIDGFNPGAYEETDLFATLTVAGETYDDPVWTGYEELSGIGTLEFTVPPDKVTAGNAYEGEVKVGFRNETLGENVVYTRKREFFVQGRQEKAGPKTDWFHETDLEMPTNYVPETAMPVQCLATVETTVLFTGQTFVVEYQTATNAVQGAVRIVDDGRGGWKFQYYACVGKTNEDSFVRGWWDFNFSGEGAEEIKPERGKSYTVYMQADYFDDTHGGENTLVISALETGDNRPPRTQFIGNLVNAEGGKGNTPRLNSVGFAGEGLVASLGGNYYTNSVNANLARINGTEYATVAAAVAAVGEGQAIRLLHAASWKPTEADVGKPVRFLNKSCLNLDLSGLPEGMKVHWTKVDGNDGTLTVAPIVRVTAESDEGWLDLTVGDRIAEEPEELIVVDPAWDETDPAFARVWIDGEDEPREYTCASNDLWQTASLEPGRYEVELMTACSYYAAGFWKTGADWVVLNGSNITADVTFEEDKTYLVIGTNTVADGVKLTVTDGAKLAYDESAPAGFKGGTVELPKRYETKAVDGDLYRIVEKIKGSEDNPWEIGDGVEAYTNGTDNLVIVGAGTIADLSAIPAGVKRGIAAVTVADATDAAAGSFFGFDRVTVTLPDNWQGELPDEKDTWCGATNVELTRWPMAVKNVKPQQRYPWNGLVDVTYDVSGTGSVKVVVSVMTNGVKAVANPTVTGDVTADLGDGKELKELKLTWDAKADFGDAEKHEKIKVKLTVSPAEPD